MSRSYRDFTHLIQEDLDYIASHLVGGLVRGDIVVAGTLNGGDVMLIQKFTSRRNIVVIDSFSGCSAPTPEDGQYAHPEFEHDCGGVERWRSHFAAIGHEPPSEVYEMWIDRDTVKSIPHRPVAFIWLDVDQYIPTSAVLGHFLEDMVPGGVILVHDVGCPKTPGTAQALSETGLIYDVWHNIGRIKF